MPRQEPLSQCQGLAESPGRTTQNDWRRCLVRCARPPSPSRRGRGQCTQAPIGIGSAKCVRDIAEILARSLQGQIRRLIAEQRVEGPSNVGRRRYVIVRDRKMVIHLEFRVLRRLGRQALGVDDPMHRVKDLGTDLVAVRADVQEQNRMITDDVGLGAGAWRLPTDTTADSVRAISRETIVCSRITIIATRTRPRSSAFR